jgi:hypothetical protein
MIIGSICSTPFCRLAASWCLLHNRYDIRLLVPTICDSQPNLSEYTHEIHYVLFRADHHAYRYAPLVNASKFQLEVNHQRNCNIFCWPSVSVYKNRLCPTKAAFSFLFTFVSGMTLPAPTGISNTLAKPSTTRCRDKVNHGPPQHISNKLVTVNISTRILVLRQPHITPMHMLDGRQVQDTKTSTSTGTHEKTRSQKTKHCFHYHVATIKPRVLMYDTPTNQHRSQTQTRDRSQQHP